MAFCFLNELIWQDELKKVPAALREKHIQRLDTELAQSYGIVCVAAETGWMQVRFNDAANFFRFLDVAGVCAVELETQDLPVLLGHTFDALVLKRAMEQGVVRLGRLEPSEIMNTIREKSWELQQTVDTEGQTGVSRVAAAADLHFSGILPGATAHDDIFWDKESRASGHYDGGSDRGELPKELTETQTLEFDPFQ